MYKKLILCAALLMAPTLGLAQTTAAASEPIYTVKEVACGPSPQLLESIQSKFKEQPLWLGRDTVTSYVLMVNAETREWTLVQFNDQIACIIGVGKDHTLVSKSRSL